jgi:hypothetical protein
VRCDNARSQLYQLATAFLITTYDAYKITSGYLQLQLQQTALQLCIHGAPCPGAQGTAPAPGALWLDEPAHG